jgi:putative acyl-CoA dehydrogenase
MTANYETDRVFNQSPPFHDVNLFTADTALQEAVRREGGAHAQEQLIAFGAACGTAEAFERGRLANEYVPRLQTHDATGQRRDIVEYHPAYHECMALSMSAGLHCSVWEHLAAAVAKPQGVNVARAGGFYMAAQMEAGHCCPVTMTNAAVPTLRLQPELAAPWLAKLLSRTYDPRFRPGPDKAAVTFGMGMTEKQGGTDVRANTTRAVPADHGGPGREYILTGHKWFLSAPMCDAFLVLAQARGSLSCFLLPRFLPDGTVNALRFQRLKDKLGNRSNASCEVELQGAHGWLIGEEGRGVPAIIEMVTFTRLDCAVASAGLMRLAVARAIHHCRHRAVFGRRLVEHPLMSHVLADLVLDVEAATALAFRLARSFDHSEDPRAAAWRRLMTPVTKYWVCKVAPPLVAEAMECLGGNGYVEEHGLARVYREVPVNSIWEGSGNVMALDVLRVLQRERPAADAVIEELTEAVGDDPQLKGGLERVRALLHQPQLLEIRARMVLEGLALLAAGAILRAHAPAAVADAFIATRLTGAPRQTYGQGLEHADTRAILARACCAKWS